MLNDRSVDEPDVEVSEDDPFAVLLTSGTTGFPKGCLSTQRTFVFHCINNAIEKGLGVHDTAILSSPIYFNAGRSFTLGIIYFGGTMILHERFDAEEVLKTVEREKVTYIGAVPTMCERMLHVLESKKYDTSSLRCLAITGGKVHPSVLEDLRKNSRRTSIERMPPPIPDRWRSPSPRYGLQTQCRGTAGLVCRSAHRRR